MGHLDGCSGGIRKTRVVVAEDTSATTSKCPSHLTHSVMSFPHSPHKPPICMPCLHGSLIEITAFSLASCPEMISPSLIFQALTSPSAAESQVPNLVSGVAPTPGGVCWKE